MGPKISVDEILATLEQRAIFHREQEALHAKKAAEHLAEQALHAAELEKLEKSLEAFRAAAAPAVELAQPLGAQAVREELELPPPGRLMVSRLIRLIVQRSGLAEPFGASDVAAEANRRFGDRLRKLIHQRTASDVLRRMLAEGEISSTQEGKAFHEALYTRRPPR